MTLLERAITHGDWCLQKGSLDTEESEELERGVCEQRSQGPRGSTGRTRRALPTSFQGVQPTHPSTSDLWLLELLGVCCDTAEVLGERWCGPTGQEEDMRCSSNPHSTPRSVNWPSGHVWSRIHFVSSSSNSFLTLEVTDLQRAHVESRGRWVLGQL